MIDDVENLSSSERLVLIAINRYYNNEKGYSYPSQSMLRQSTGISNNGTLCKAITGLIEKEYITKDTRKGVGCRYYILKNKPSTELNLVQKCTKCKSELRPSSNVNYDLVQKCTTTITKQINNNTSEIKKRNLDKQFSVDSNEYRLAEYMLKKIKEISPSFKEPNIQRWCSDFDKILRIDKRSPNETVSLITKIYEDDFWQRNILSPAKLRKQYDRLIMQFKIA